MTVRDMVAAVSTLNRAAAAAILGVGPHATQTEIKAAYRTAVKRTHPDVTGSGRADQLEKFFAVREAFHVLTTQPAPAATRPATTGAPDTGGVHRPAPPPPPPPRRHRRPLTPQQARFVAWTVPDAVGCHVDRRG